ncbi:hypothetical protein OK074_3202 [Actinobacteria bacterium OK074]|nr:hypothetical protein OK074_3202 [Actinobacteria bacterium OK074]
MSAAGGGTNDGALGARLRRFQARAEPLVTRFILLGIFVTGLTAQFVQPLGDALQNKTFLGGSLLSLVGYVLYGKLVELSPVAPERPQPVTSSRQLGSFVSEAFRARRVEISFLGYTGETLFSELYHHLDALREHPGQTRHVSIRMMVPDFDQSMTVPSRVGPDGKPVDDPEFRQRLARQCAQYDEMLSGLAERITAGGTVAVESEYRCYTGSPRDKTCILNSEQVLHGLYDVSARLRLRQGDPKEYFDPKGASTDLTILSRKDGAAAERDLATWNKYLDDQWDLALTPSWRRAAGAGDGTADAVGSGSGAPAG